MTEDGDKVPTRQWSPATVVRRTMPHGFKILLQRTGAISLRFGLLVVGLALVLGLLWWNRETIQGLPGVSPIVSWLSKKGGPISAFFVSLFGGFGLFLFGLVVLLWWLWWNWDKIQNRPGVSSIISWISRKTLQKADPERFAVAIAHLQNDKDHEHEALIAEALKGFEGVQVLRADRTISPLDEKVEAGHEKAREYLKESGAHILIWGLVHHISGEDAPRLYWTTSRESKRSKEVYQPEGFKLPELFWNDLVEVLGLVVVTQSAEFFADEGHFIADKIEPFIKKVRDLLESAELQGRDTDATDTRVKVRVILADSLNTFGKQAGKNEPLEEAVGAYREALKEWTRDRVPLDWAMTQNNLGNALGRLGERESGTKRLEEAVGAYREALKEWTRDRVPLDWAMTQNNLGIALQTLGERGGNATLVCEALKNHLAAWEVFSRGAPHYASIALNGTQKTVDLLKKEFEPSTYQVCVKQHAKALKQMGLS